MGLSNALSGGIIMVALISVLLTVPGIVGTTSIVQDASIEISQIEADIYDTDISISSLSGTATSDTITFTLTNTGSEKLWNYEKFDVFIVYNGAVSGQITEKLGYSSTCAPAAGNWCIIAFNDDQLDPQILNEGENISVTITASENLATGILILSVSTDNGVTTTDSTAI